MSDIQERVQATIDDLVAAGTETGLQVAVYADGELVVDAVAGVADVASGRPVTSDTPFFSFSIGKGVAATAVHVLAEQGVVDYDTPIADVWPEFAAHGKSAITLRTPCPSRPECRACRPGSRSMTCPTGRRCARRSPPRRRGGTLARRSATTPSPGGSSSVRSSAG